MMAILHEATQIKQTALETTLAKRNLRTLELGKFLRSSNLQKTEHSIGGTEPGTCSFCHEVCTQHATWQNIHVRFPGSMWNLIFFVTGEVFRSELLSAVLQM